MNYSSKPLTEKDYLLELERVARIVVSCRVDEIDLPALRVALNAPLKALNDFRQKRIKQIITNARRA